MTPMIGLGNSLAKASFLGPSFVNSYSVDLDGTDDFVNFGNSSTIKLTTTDTSEEDGITVAVWAKKDDWDVTTTACIMGCFANNGGWTLEYGGRLLWRLRRHRSSR